MDVRVEVFPVAPDRWIAVVEEAFPAAAPVPPGVGPDRWRMLLDAFSTEAATAARVEHVVYADLTGWLGVRELDLELVDDLGRPWSPRDAPAQASRLHIAYPPDFRPPPPRRRRALLGRPRPVPEDCPVCGHDWREHDAADGGCGECSYEVSHEDPDAPTAVCSVAGPAATASS